MDISNIPKTFWHSISIAILISTIGLTIIAYRSASVSIEIANAKINLLSAIEETEKINESLRQNNTKLKNEYAKIVEIISSSKKQSNELESYNILNLPEFKDFDLDKDFISEESFSKNQLNLNELRKSLK